MRKFYLLPFMLISSLLIFSCNQSTSVSQNEPSGQELLAVDLNNIIPLPLDIKQDSGYFLLKNTHQILVNASHAKLVKVAAFLKKELTEVIPSPVYINVLSDENLQNEIKNTTGSHKNKFSLSVDSSIEGGDEAYRISIQPSLVTITGGSEAGVFRAIQTLKQLLSFPPQKNVDQETYLALKTGTINDFPRFEYRGFMLDVARHFYSVAEVKEIIDHLAAYKYNVFHFHLTDDQGWRIEIPSWPKLTTVGSNSAVGQTTCKNCFYSLEQYQEIVRYADERFITLIPEIDVPGHVRAALASYPEELYCDGNKPDWPYTDIKVSISSLCFSNPKIYEFFDDVVREVAKRTLGKYIHIGGDETPKWVKHQDYSDFMLKAYDIVKKHGKTIVGWTNDLGSVEGLTPDVIGQHWSTKKHCCETTMKMANRGSKIVMSPANKSYLDLKYDKDTAIGLKWAGFNSIENSYNWDPETNIESLNPNSIIGVEAALWGETITSMNDAQYMIFPRLLTLSEVAWSPQDKRSWQSFTKRLAFHIEHLKKQNINYRPLSKMSSENNLGQN
ncbi:MAG: family 20 glycosylhydrolase [Colwellia sp.]|nr:family 20 glycosylhydrolase [Colwellia sp.]